MSGLQHLLGHFAERVNHHASLRSTLANWSPEFFIEAQDSGATYQVHINAGQVHDVCATEDEPGDDALLLRGDNAVLERIFSGTLSPLGAYTNGLLQVYGPQKDQIKLDVIALVLWGA